MREVIMRLQQHIDLISDRLGFEVSENIEQKLQNIVWIGIENDYKEGFPDLIEALQQLNFIQLNVDTI